MDEILGSFVEIYTASQVALSGTKSTLMGQEFVEATQAKYDLFLVEKLSVSERVLIGTIVVLSIATAITQTGRNFVKKTFGAAKGKVQDLFKRFSKRNILLSKRKFGHTFTTHGKESTDFLINRAKGSGLPQGQFLDDQKAAKFILDNLERTKNGAVTIPIPKGFPARIILPNGKFIQATGIRLIPSGSGVKSAFPVF